MIAECINNIYKEIEALGHKPEHVLSHNNILDDEDLICFALSFVLANIEEALIEPFEENLIEVGGEYPIDYG